MLHSAVYIITAIVIAVWIVRAQKNARSFGAHGEISPGWAVGYFFLPHCESLETLSGDEGALDRQRSRAIPCPAAAQLVDPVAPYLPHGVHLPANQQARAIGGDLAWDSQFDILAMAVGLPLTALALGIVLNITRAQTERSGAG